MKKQPARTRQRVSACSSAGACPLVEFFAILSGKWALPVAYELLKAPAPLRFGELHRAVGSITQKELSKTLKEFERCRLVRRTVFAEVPLRVEYEMTTLGRTLKTPLAGLATWVDRYGRRMTPHK
jgi:DNA-binding HxlR family transcriptional regulator